MTINNKIKSIINELKKCDTIVGISLVGSYVRAKNPNDIDFLIISINNAKTKKYIQKEFKKYNPYINDDSVRINNYINLEIGMGIYNLKKLNNQIKQYILGKNVDPIYKNWNIVGWLPECLLYDLNTMEVLYDEYHYLEQIKNKINNYPIKFKHSIIENCDIKINNLEKRKPKVKKLELQILESEILSLKIRKSFAENEIYFSGFKNIDEKLIESGIYNYEKQ